MPTSSRPSEKRGASLGLAADDCLDQRDDVVLQLREGSTAALGGAFVWRLDADLEFVPGDLLHGLADGLKQTMS